MSVDVFGRSLKSKIKILKGPPGHGFSLTTSEDYDICGKKLCNVGEPEDVTDAINLNFLKTYIQSIKQEIINYNSGLLNQEFTKIEELLLQEKKRAISFSKDIIWPLIREINEIRRQRKEPLEKINKIARDFLDYIAE